jgi:preprotein translocase subunit SecA
MIDEIRMEIASRLHLIRIQVAPADGARKVSRSYATTQSASHSSMDSFGSGGTASGGNAPPTGMSGASRPNGATVVRSHPKVGRNDPCPCGSGRKYKQCHGR